MPGGQGSSLLRRARAGVVGTIVVDVIRRAWSASIPHPVRGATSSVRRGRRTAYGFGAGSTASEFSVDGSVIVNLSPGLTVTGPLCSVREWIRRRATKSTPAPEGTDPGGIFSVSVRPAITVPSRTDP